MAFFQKLGSFLIFSIECLGWKIYFVTKIYKASLDKDLWNAFLMYKAVAISLGRGHPLWAYCKGEREWERKLIFLPEWSLSMHFLPWGSLTGGAWGRCKILLGSFVPPLRCTRILLKFSCSNSWGKGACRMMSAKRTNIPKPYIMGQALHECDFK